MARLKSVLCLGVFVMSLACHGTHYERAQKVGRIERSYVDVQRLNWSGDGPRPMLSMIWFPTDSAADEEPWLIGNRFFPLFKAGQSVPNADLSERSSRYPLIVLSHGTGGAVAQLAWLAEGLASGGYIVAAVNHHGNTAIEEKTPHGFFLWWERATDLSRLIDLLIADEVLGPHIDPKRIGAAGFSLGGYTVLELAGARTNLEQIERYCVGRPEDPSCTLPMEAPFSMDELTQYVENDARFRASMARHGESYLDERVRSVIAIAPAGIVSQTEESFRNLRVPTLIIVGDRDSIAPSTSNANPAADLIPDSRLEVLSGVGHYTFMSECGIAGKIASPSICAEEGGIAREGIHQRVAADAKEFFGLTLRVP
ncbi:alpha/beta fold hydrolase [Myxococcota bacterium]|nr:alpha/beta fold hydrolase [Myxococcota bacterium]